MIGDIEAGATVELRSRGLVGGMMNKVNDLVKNYDNNYKRVKDTEGTVPLSTPVIPDLIQQNISALGKTVT